MASIYDGEKYLYAEQLKGKAVTLTIKRIEGDIDFCDTQGRKKKGYDLYFAETPKIFGAASVTIKRQLRLALGTEDPRQMVGKKITLYPIKCAQSIAGEAIRIKTPTNARTAGHVIAEPTAEQANVAQTDAVGGQADDLPYEGRE